MCDSVDTITLTRDGLVDILKQCITLSQGDPDYAHGEADRALLNYINDKEITELFDNIIKWYA